MFRDCEIGREIPPHETSICPDAQNLCQHQDRGDGERQEPEKADGESAAGGTRAGNGLALAVHGKLRFRPEQNLLGWRQSGGGALNRP